MGHPKCLPFFPLPHPNPSSPKGQVEKCMFHLRPSPRGPAPPATSARAPRPGPLPPPPQGPAPSAYLETVASDAAPPSREWRHKEIPLLAAAAAAASNHPQNNPSGG